MALLTGRTQSLPEIDEALQGRYAKISKANWCDVFFDLYRESYGEHADDTEIMADAERRLEILERYRDAEHQGLLVPRREHCFLCGDTMGAGTDSHQCCSM